MKTTAFILMILLFFSCQKDDNDDQVYGDYIWGTLISSEKSVNKVTFSIINPRPFSNYVAPGPTTPDYFNVYVSDDTENSELIQKLKVGTTALEVKNLTNDKPYYFYVLSHRDGYETVVSRTIMTIPSKKIPVLPFRKLITQIIT